MNFIFSYMKKYKSSIFGFMLIKLSATFLELLIPYVLEYMIDTAAPLKNTRLILACGIIMIFLAILVRVFNVLANRHAVKVASKCIFSVRKDLFDKTLNLSGYQTDAFGLPSLTSRMTSDSYNIQTFIRQLQTLAVRAPMLLIGGIVLTMTMDTQLSLLLCTLSVLLIILVVFISVKGVSLYDTVQRKVDSIVRIMRENITGVRVVRSLSKEEYEEQRYEKANQEMTDSDIKAGTVMALPSPLMQLVLNMGLAFVVILGAIRVNNGGTQPGVILAFLTYFNMIMTGVMGLNRIFLMTSKASASAKRIEDVIIREESLKTIAEQDANHTDKKAFIVFDNVSFMYGHSDLHREERRLSLKNISFEIEKGGSLGIIGPTGSGKTSIVNLLMRFYDATDGTVFIDGKDIRTYDKKQLRSRFGVALQNDVLFADTIKNNIVFGRNVSDEKVAQACEDARANTFISDYEDKYEHRSDFHGSNFSGGQKQRLLIARALVADPEVLILDDSSSALDYKTDSEIRKAMNKNKCTTIVIAQRISSIMNMDRILVLDEGNIIGYGTHEQLMNSCGQYREIFKTQMGDLV